MEIKVNCYSSAVDCSILLKTNILFDHVTANTLQMFEVKASKIEITA